MKSMNEPLLSQYYGDIDIIKGNTLFSLSVCSYSSDFDYCAGCLITDQISPDWLTTIRQQGFTVLKYFHKSHPEDKEDSFKFLPTSVVITKRDYETLRYYLHGYCNKYEIDSTDSDAVDAIKLESSFKKCLAFLGQRGVERLLQRREDELLKDLEKIGFGI